MSCPRDGPGGAAIWGSKNCVPPYCGAGGESTTLKSAPAPSPRSPIARRLERARPVTLRLQQVPAARRSPAGAVRGSSWVWRRGPLELRTRERRLSACSARRRSGGDRVIPGHTGLGMFGRPTGADRSVGSDPPALRSFRLQRPSCVPEVLENVPHDATLGASVRRGFPAPTGTADQPLRPRMTLRFGFPEPRLIWPSGPAGLLTDPGRPGVRLTSRGRSRSTPARVQPPAAVLSAERRLALHSPLRARPRLGGLASASETFACRACVTELDLAEIDRSSHGTPPLPLRPSSTWSIYQAPTPSAYSNGSA